MKNWWKGRLAFILICSALMLTAVVIVGEALFQQDHTSPKKAPLAPLTEKDIGDLKGESAVFLGLNQTSRFAEGGLAQPTSLADKYDRRAYPGAPPPVPHPVLPDMKTSWNNCASCHATGGFVKELSAYTPVVPHPELTNCGQCHVPQHTQSVFRDSGFEKIKAHRMGQSAMVGSPPAIPHEIQLRENCAACHTGPAAAPELRTTHADRANCRQCHVPADGGTPFQRNATGENE